MAKKDLRAQMDAARAAAAFIGAAQEADQARGAQEAPAPASSAAVSVEASPSVAYEVVSLAEEAPRAAGSPGEAPPAVSERTLSGQASSSSSRADGGVAIVALDASDQFGGVAALADVAPAAGAGRRGSSKSAEKPKTPRTRKPRKKAPEPVEEPADSSARMTAQVLVPMTAEQREHADLLAQVMKITRAEVMRQALDEYWDNHKAELQAAVMAYEQLIRKLMK